MVYQVVAFGGGNVALDFFNVGVEKFFNVAAVKADEVVVVLAKFQFVDGFVVVEVAAPQ